MGTWGVIRLLKGYGDITIYNGDIGKKIVSLARIELTNTNVNTKHLHGIMGLQLV